MKLVASYLLLINLITFVLFFVDKEKAKRKKWRIKESVLLGFSAFGGALGGIAAMQLFRHKTQTPKFTFGMPLILVLQIFVFVYCKSEGII